MRLLILCTAILSVRRFAALVEKALSSHAFATRESSTGGQIEAGLAAEVSRHVSRVCDASAAFVAS